MLTCDMENLGGQLVATAVLILLFCSTPVKGINCVQCMSESSNSCIDSPPAPRACDEAARFCIVVRENLLHNASVVTVTRTCSPVDLGSKCHDSFSLAGENVLVCHEACGTDGCNGIPQNFPKAVSAGHTTWLSRVLFITVIVASLTL